MIQLLCAENLLSLEQQSKLGSSLQQIPMGSPHSINTAWKANFQNTLSCVGLCLEGYLDRSGSHFQAFDCLYKETEYVKGPRPSLEKALPVFLCCGQEMNLPTAGVWEETFPFSMHKTYTTPPSSLQSVLQTAAWKELGGNTKTGSRWQHCLGHSC